MLTMEQRERSNYAAAKGAQIRLEEEECAFVMELRTSDATTMDAQTKLSKEECASVMGQRSSDAASKDVQIRRREEECAGGMGHITTEMMNLLHLDQSSNRLLQIDPNPMSMLLDLRS